MSNVTEEIAAAEIRDALLGKRCWYAYAGFGCTFAMDLGKKLPRDPQDAAHMEKRCRHHPAEYREYEGESHLLVWCSWRLEGRKGPLASMDNDFGVCRNAIAGVIGRTVQSVYISPSWELKLELGSDLLMTVFPDHVGPKANFDGNWELWRPDRAYLIGTDLKCGIIKRDYPPLVSRRQRLTIPSVNREFKTTKITARRS